MQKTNKMEFFETTFFSRLPETLRGGTTDVITAPINCFTMDGPSFVVEGSMEDLDLLDLLNKIAKKAEAAKEKLSKLKGYVYESLQSLPDLASGFNSISYNTLFSVYCSHYSATDKGPDEVAKDPFIANGDYRDVLRHLYVICGRRSVSSCFLCYEPNSRETPDRELVALPRDERFKVEDVYRLIKEAGSISMHQSITGDRTIDKDVQIEEESREAGARVEYYENHQRFIQWNTNEVGLMEILRVERHFLVPTISVSFEIATNSKKSSFVVLPEDENHLICMFPTCPDCITRPPKQTDSEKPKKKTLFEKLFK